MGGESHHQTTAGTVMDPAAQKIVTGCAMILDQVRFEHKLLLDIAEDKEKRDLRETVYDLEQACSLLNRAISR